MWAYHNLAIDSGKFNPVLQQQQQQCYQHGIVAIEDLVKNMKTHVH
jgi:hypothetical protein